MDKPVTFIQICSTEKLKNRSVKKQQWDNLKKSIEKLVESNKLSINRYELLYGEPQDFKEDKCEDLINKIKKAIGLNK